MSLSLTLTETIDKVIETFVTRVSEQYNLDKTELRYLWDDKEVKATKTKKSPVVSKPIPDEVDPEALLKCNKAELIAMCKVHGHKCSGTKSILMGRLLGKESVPTNKKTSVKKKQPSKTPLAKKLTANIPNILIRRNKFNNYEHPETGLVFDNKDRIVIGKQKDDGSIDDLTEEDIDQCNAFKFKYNLPVNLDHKSTLANVKVDELSEGEESEEDEDLVAEDEDEDEIELEDDEDEELLDEEELLGDDEEEYEEECEEECGEDED